MTKKKTKAEIERDFPIIKPENCPGELMEWISRRDTANMQNWRLLIREELKPVGRFMKMAMNNRIWLIVLTAAVTAFGFILIYHLSVR